MVSVLWLAASAGATPYVGADWGGADLILADGDEVSGTFTNVGRFEVPAGATVRVGLGTPLEVNANSVVIAGTLDGTGAGHPGGNGIGPAATGQGPGGGAGDDSSTAGAGGGANGGDGGDGMGGSCGFWIPGWAGGASYGTPDDPLDAQMGSGGGDNWGVGGAGGASVALRADTVTILVGGAIRVDGTDGFSAPTYEGGAGAGGGAGGTIVLDAVTAVAVDGELTAAGGDGFEGDAALCDKAGGGGGGGGGRIKVYGPFSGALDPSAVSGGLGGASDGSRKGFNGRPGTEWVDDLVGGAAPVLSAVGTCGASVTATVSGGTPYGGAVVLTGTGSGSDPLTTGRCAGAVTGLTAPEEHRFLQLDAVGGASQTGSLANNCGADAQVLDLWTCTLSPLIVLP